MALTCTEEYNIYNVTNKRLSLLSLITYLVITSYLHVSELASTFARHAFQIKNGLPSKAKQSLIAGYVSQNC